MVHSRPAGSRRVSYLMNSMAAGGAESQVRWVVQAFDPSRYRAQLAWYNDSEGFFEPPPGVPAGLLPRGGKFDPRFGLALAGWMSRRRTDVIHAWQAPPAFYASLARLLPGRAPVIGAVAHSATLFPVDHVSRTLHPIAARVADHTTVNCRDVIPWLVDRGIDRDRITYIPNILPPPLVDRVPSSVDQRQALLQKLGLDPGRRPIVQLARVDANKNAEGLLTALLALRRNGVDVPPLLLAGRLVDDALVARLRRQAEEAGYDDDLHIVGPVQDVPTLVEAARLTVLASLSEGMPNVVLEAMGLGGLVVATRVGEVPGMIRDGHDGLLCPPGDIDALAAQLKVALELSPAQVSEMGARARAAMLQRHTPATVLGQLCDLFDAVIDRAQPPWLRPRTIFRGS